MYVGCVSKQSTLILEVLDSCRITIEPSCFVLKGSIIL